MSLNVSALSTFTDENLLPLIKKSILGGRTVEYITVQPGIKSSAKINTLNSTLVAAAGSCGWTAAGSTILDQADLSVCPIKINESICLETLESYYTQVQMRPGSYNEEIPFEQVYAEEKADAINALVDDMFWQGDVAAGVGNLALCDGMMLAIDNSVGKITATATGALTAANAIASVDEMVALTPTAVIDADDLTLFMGYDSYRVWATALRNANLFHYSGAEGDDFSMYVPGTNVKVVAVRGLNGTDSMYLSPASNLFLGTDLLSDTEAFSLFYSADNDEVRFLAKWKQGVGIAFPGFVVQHVA